MARQIDFIVIKLYLMSGRSVLMEEEDMRISREEGIQPILLKFPLTDEYEDI